MFNGSVMSGTGGDWLPIPKAGNRLFQAKGAVFAATGEVPCSRKFWVFTKPPVPTGWAMAFP
ncbi:MAG: hypothetical protein RSC66_05270, partial [Comamonas sp.]